MSITWTRLPFRFESPADYARQVSAWVGHAFYDVLPAAGYEVREEQIYFSFRVAAALTEGRPILAEAGSGTGKTFAYLLPAICHARLRGRPVVVATASPALESQLVAPDGDIAALSRLLGLDVEARTARRPQDVVCDLRLERLAASAHRVAGRAGLLRWAERSAAGARAEYPAAADSLWERVAWNAACRCDTCPRRGYCRLTRGREAARSAADILVCSHDLFFEDAFHKDALPPGRLPVLPPFSGVVFDEGHRVAASAQRSAGFRLRPDEVRVAIDGCEGQGVRLALLHLADAARGAAARFATALAAAVGAGGEDGEPRRPVAATPALVAAARDLDRVLGRLQDEMAIEEGLHEETAYGGRLAAYHTWLDAAQGVCRGLADTRLLPFVEGDDLWVVPRDLGPVWRAHLPERTPLVFSSATLSAAGSFDYSARRLGLENPATARVGVPFRLAAQVLCYLPRDLPPAAAADFWPRASRRIAELLAATGGRALILVPHARALRALRSALQAPCRVLWEGDAGPEALLRDFTADTASCLVGHSFWEGVDVPGETLSAVVVPELPLPGADPLVQARRDAAAAGGGDAFTAVDVPAMALRLKQGVGRLIRRETDRGVVAILDGAAAPAAAARPPHGGAGPAAAETDGARRASLLAAALESSLPDGARRVRTLPPVARFLASPAAR